MEGEITRAAFDATLDDFVDVQLRILQYSPAGRSWRRNTAFANTALYGFATLAIMLLARPAGPTGSRAYLVIALGTSLTLGMLVGYLSKSSYTRTLHRRTKQFLEEQFDGPGPYGFEIELRADGVWTRQVRGEAKHPWSEVTDIEETAAGIEIRLRTGLIVARNRAFATPVAREAFLSSGRAHMLDSQRVA